MRDVHGEVTRKSSGALKVRFEKKKNQLTEAVSASRASLTYEIYMDHVGQGDREGPGACAEWTNLPPEPGYRDTDLFQSSSQGPEEETPEDKEGNQEESDMLLRLHKTKKQSWAESF